MTNKLPKIRGFHNVLKEMQIEYGSDMPKAARWHSKIKLHGTNAAIRFEQDGSITAQKRSDDISVDNDNFGFALHVESMRPMLERWFEDYCKSYILAPNQHVTICGEWAGPGVQKSVAVSQIPAKHFFVFAIMIGEKEVHTDMIFKASVIEHILYGGAVVADEWQNARVRVIPDHKDYTVDTRFKENLEAFVEEANKEVEAIEACDPYIKSVFGIEGIGEGLVFYPHGSTVSGKSLCDIYCSKSEFERRAFKVKGEKHAVNKAGKPARVKSAIPKSAYDFVDMHVTEARLEQGLDEVGGVDIKKTGQFIGWVCRDVALESAQEIEESGMAWKGCLSGVVATRAREWFIRKCEEL